MNSIKEMPETTDIVVVGAGPAGLAAARAASEAGANVVVLDEYARPGGQYFRQGSQGNILPASIVGTSQRKGAAEIAALDRDKVVVLNGALVWGVFSPDSVTYTHAGVTRTLSARAIVLATGAYERTIAFPGWTLPGVMTAGAAQTMLKEHGVRVGKRIALAGSGAFLFPVSTQLAAAGAEIAVACEAVRDAFWLLRSPKALLQPDKLLEGAGYLFKAARYRVPFRFGWTVIEARGEGRVEEVTIARIDDNWRALPGSEMVLSVDTLLINFGFIPNLQLPRLLGCTIHWDATLATYCTTHDADQRATVAGVYVAGETTGLGGHRVAMGEGFVAGRTAAFDIGFNTRALDARQLASVRRQLEKDRFFVDHVNRTFSLREGIYDRIEGRITVCRCEEVSASSILKVAQEWDGSLRAVKQCTRAGMGPCQGRICESMVARLAARASQRDIQSLGVDSVRPAVKPVPLDSFRSA